MIYYLKLRAKQFARILQSAGIMFSLLLLLVFIAIGFKFLISLSQISPLVIFALGFFIIYGLHTNRSDAQFLVQRFPDWIERSLVKILEGLLLLAPLTLFFGFQSNWKNLLALIIGIVLAGIAPPLAVSKMGLKFDPGRFVGPSVFELKSLVRANFFALTMIYILGLFSFVHISIYILSMLFLTAYMAKLYESYEPKEWIKWEPSFLSKKIILHASYVSLLCIPIHVSFLSAQGEFLSLAVYIIFTMAIFIAFCITYKYANYYPFGKAKLNSGFLGVAIMFAILPGFIIANLAMAIFFYIKAQKRMKLYAGT